MDSPDLCDAPKSEETIINTDKHTSGHSDQNCEEKHSSDLCQLPDCDEMVEKVDEITSDNLDSDSKSKECLDLCEELGIEEMVEKTDIIASDNSDICKLEESLDLCEESETEEMVVQIDQITSANSGTVCEDNNSDLKEYIPSNNDYNSNVIRTSSKRSRIECKKDYIDAKRRAKELVLKGSGLQPDQLKKLNDFNDIISHLKVKVQNSSRNIQCQILTLLVNIWSSKKISIEFGVSVRLAKKAKALRERHGILLQIPLKCNLKEADDTMLLAFKFFEDNRVSCELQGPILIKVNGQIASKRKRLLLFNLKEIHSQFLMIHPKSPISFSQLCLMQPNWCTSSISPGEGSFCKLHQNVKLMIQSLPRSHELAYEDLLRLMLCKDPVMACYTNKCDNCPGPSTLEKYLINRFDDDDLDKDDEVAFLEWSNSSNSPHSVLMQVEDFVARLVERCQALKFHHFIANVQSQFLTETISNLDKESAVVILDFSENFSFVLKDRIDGFHRSPDQATIHPYIVHYRNEIDNTKSLHLCIISNCLVHNHITSYAFNKEMVKVVRNKLPQIQRIIYFSHSSEKNYKNKGNLKNLCFQKKDFGIKAEWHFLPTNHGKKMCNKIAARVKHFATSASLQRPVNHQILSAEALYDWSNDHLDDIHFIYVSNQQVQEVQETIEARMKAVYALKGVISYHAFVPTAMATLKCAITSSSSDWKKQNLLQLPSVAPTAYRSGCVVICLFDSKWWLGMITDVAKDGSDHKVSFMHPNGPATIFHWPEIVDECYIPADDILCSGIAPIALPNRHYELSEQEKNIISDCVRRNNTTVVE